MCNSHTPLYKKSGSTDNISNYMPISILPTTSKVLEVAVKEQVMNYFTENNLFCTEQSTYLSSRSTVTPLHSAIKRGSNYFD